MEKVSALEALFWTIVVIGGVAGVCSLMALAAEALEAWKRPR